MLKNPLLYALLVFIGKLVLLSASLGDALVVVALCTLIGVQLFLENKRQEPVNDALKQEIADIKSSLTALKIGRTFVK